MVGTIVPIGEMHISMPQPPKLKFSSNQSLAPESWKVASNRLPNFEFNHN